MATYFCADNELFPFMRAARLQQAFHVLTELFEQVVFHTKIGKTASIDFQPCSTIRGHYMEA